ncbi:hypothetical protein ACFLIN_03375 [Corynebacterium kutscheri]|uniref:hypothetical protein n=1 Tax=Corynebacterium kutscheri TaxID=35755 RepID=UPI0037C06E08
MFHAVVYALLDSLNVLLIGLIVVVGVMQPKNGKYGKIVSLLIAGDWLGVFLLALVTMFIFDGLGEIVKTLVESPTFGIILIVVGVISFFLALKGGDSTELMAKLLPPLQRPSIKTFFGGMALGMIQSVTSAPFFAGIAVLSAGDFSVMVRYVGMFFYASLALSLPFLTALLVAMVRHYPESPAGRFFIWMRGHKDQASQYSGYSIAIVLIAMGVLHL